MKKKSIDKKIHVKKTTNSYLLPNTHVKSTKVNSFKYLQENYFKMVKTIVNLIPNISILKLTFKSNK